MLWTRHGGYSWHFFAHGAVLLFGGHPAGLNAPGGLDLYASYPQYQIGPLTFVIAALVAPLGLWAAELLMLLLGLWVMICVERLVGARGRLTARRLLIAELAASPLWVVLAVHYAHLDDALALALAVTAITALGTRRLRWVGPLLGAAVAAKPWAAGFLPLVWALPRDQRRWALAWMVGLPAASWMPFIIDDPATVWSVSHFTISNTADSALRALGVTDPSTPGWCRSAQLALGLGVGGLAVGRGRWPAVLLAAVAARLLLDPSTYDYYTAGAMVAALVLDASCGRGRVPVASLTAAVGLYLPHLLALAAPTAGGVRLVTCLVLLALCLVGSPANLPRAEDRLLSALTSTRRDARAAFIGAGARSVHRT